MIKLPSHTDIVYFVELSKTLHVTRAAKRLGISQPTLTVSIQRLERDLKSVLFIREKTGIRLTREGDLFKKHAVQLLSQWAEIAQATQGESKEVRGILRFGSHPSVARYALPKVFCNFIQQNPHIEIRMEHDLSRKILDKLVRGDVDCALIMNPSPHPDLILKPLLTDHVCLFETPKNKNKDVIIYDPDLKQSQTLLNPRVRKHFQRTIECSNLEVIARMVQAGCGAGILPSRVASLLTEPSLNHLKWAGAVQDQLFFAFRSTDRHTAKIQAIKVALESEFARK